MRSVISADSSGLHLSSQRRGVTPLVWLMMLAGIELVEVVEHMVAQQLRVQLADTPFTQRLPTIARCAMLTFFSGALLDQRHAPHALDVAGEAAPHLRPETAR